MVTTVVDLDQRAAHQRGEMVQGVMADAFGMVVTRTRGVFAIGDSAYGFVTEHWEPDTGRFTAYGVEVERSDVESPA